MEAQLAAIQAWLALRREDEEGLHVPLHAGRERMKELRSRNEALAAEAAALREQCHQTQVAAPRVVLVHRNAWLTGKLRQGLTGLGAHVVGAAADGAIGCGITIAEAPDLLFLEAGLPSMTGAEVLQRVQRCSPRTVIAVQVPHRDQVAAFLATGATAVWPRHVPAVELVQTLAVMLQQPSP